MKDKKLNQPIKDIFLKTLDDRYKEAGKWDRFIYWVFIALIVGVILYFYITSALH